MSIFGSIVSKIFGHANAAPAPGAAPAPNAGSASAAPSSAQPSTTASKPAGGAFNNPAPQTASPGQSAATQTASTPSSSPQAPVDVAAILNDLASKNSQKLDWRHSIVDLMKLLGLDSSLSARQELAQELHYSGSTSDSAAMNIWLHKQVMQKLADNGGKVPEELRT